MDELEKHLEEAGYKLFGNHKRIEHLIMNILKGEHTRYLKAIPFLIYKHRLTSKNLFALLEDTTQHQQLLLSVILSYTKNVFLEHNLPCELPNTIQFTSEEQGVFAKKNKLRYEDFKQEFELQLRNEGKQQLLLDKQKVYAERELRLHLSVLFTKKEIQLLQRLINDQPLSRTEYEYYSRKTKKKLMSIIGLQDFAHALYSKTPRCDEQLFLLKKLLEQFLEQTTGEQGISLQQYFTLPNKKLSLHYNTTIGLMSETRSLITTTPSSTHNVIADLLTHYPEHNFG